VLFQYGSNMDPDRLNAVERLGGAAQVVGSCHLKNWGVRFDLYSETNQCGVTDITPSVRERVEGVLYQVPYRLVIASRGQRSRMDEIEGSGRGSRSNYKREKVMVWRNREKVEARTYIGTVAGRKRFLSRSHKERQVSEAYFKHVLSGARRFNFSERYIVYLRTQAGLPI
jgi:hypothetical protein